jgi:hypothetical protein
MADNMPKGKAATQARNLMPAVDAQVRALKVASGKDRDTGPNAAAEHAVNRAMRSIDGMKLIPVA